MSKVENLVTFARLILGRKAIVEAFESAQDFVGCEVLNRLNIPVSPDSKGVFALAVITDIRWDSSVLPVNWQKGQPEGDWMIEIRYIATGWKYWTDQSALILTGTKYDDAGAAVIQAAHKAQMRMEVSHE